MPLRNKSLLIKMAHFLLFGLVIGSILLLNGKQAHAGAPQECPVVVVFGAAGDLVRRFVWRSLWEVFLETGPMVVVATSRDDVSGLLGELNSVIDCSDGSETCISRFKVWNACTNGFQLREDGDYRRLNETLLEWTSKCGCSESQRLFYLAVPPSAYASLAKQIDAFMRPSASVGSIKVALEKPFGSDLHTSLTMSEQLKQYLKEDEIYRVDHYLAKPAVRGIVQFLCHNRQHLKELLNGDNVDRVQVVARESLTAAGRTGYYDKYGVVRDMMQNHLTQVLALIVADLSADSCQSSSGLEAKRVEFLKSLNPASLHHTLLAQYADYSEHVRAGGGNMDSRTATFATTVLSSSTDSWRGTRFLLTSGKALPQKSTYAAVAFKSAPGACPKEIVFIIKDQELESGVLVSSNFGGDVITGEKGLPPTTILASDTNVMLTPGCTYLFFACQDCETEAYTNVVRSLIEGERCSFVSTESLLESWRVWTGLVEAMDVSEAGLFKYDSRNVHLIDITPWSSK